jgi:CspA family cold shock protein
VEVPCFGLKRVVIKKGSRKMATGIVKWFNDKKGYGFITADAGGSDVFVHHTGIKMEGFRTLKEGQKVEYDTEKGKKGDNAINVRSL